jgi:hypothetical protein
MEGIELIGMFQYVLKGRKNSTKKNTQNTQNVLLRVLAGKQNMVILGKMEISR